MCMCVQVLISPVVTGQVTLPGVAPQAHSHQVRPHSQDAHAAKGAHALGTALPLLAQQGQRPPVISAAMLQQQFRQLQALQTRGKAQSSANHPALAAAQAAIMTQPPRQSPASYRTHPQAASASSVPHQQLTRNDPSLPNSSAQAKASLESNKESLSNGYASQTAGRSALGGSAPHQTPAQQHAEARQYNWVQAQPQHPSQDQPASSLRPGHLRVTVSAVGGSDERSRAAASAKKRRGWQVNDSAQHPWAAEQAAKRAKLAAVSKEGPGVHDTVPQERGSPADSATDDSSRTPQYKQGGARAAAQRASLHRDHGALVPAPQLCAEEMALDGATRSMHEQSAFGMAADPASPRLHSSRIAQPQSPEPATSLANTMPDEAQNGAAWPDRDQSTVCVPRRLSSPVTGSVPSHGMQPAEAMLASSAEVAALSKAAVGQAIDLVLPLSPELDASGENEPEQAPSTPTSQQSSGPHEQSTDTVTQAEQGTPENNWDRVLTAAKEYARVLTEPQTDAMELHMAQRMRLLAFIQACRSSAQQLNTGSRREAAPRQHGSSRPHEQSTDTARQLDQGTPESGWDTVITAAKECARVLTASHSNPTQLPIMEQMRKLMAFTQACRSSAQQQTAGSITEPALRQHGSPRPGCSKGDHPTSHRGSQQQAASSEGKQNCDCQPPAHQQEAGQQPKVSPPAPPMHAGIMASAKHAWLAQQQDSLQQRCSASLPPFMSPIADASVTLQLCAAEASADLAPAGAAKAQVRQYEAPPQHRSRPLLRSGALEEEPVMPWCCLCLCNLCVPLQRPQNSASSQFAIVAVQEPPTCTLRAISAIAEPSSAPADADRGVTSDMP